jgi:hypothetical protein
MLDGLALRILHLGVVDRLNLDFARAEINDTMISCHVE